MILVRRQAPRGLPFAQWSRSRNYIMTKQRLSTNAVALPVSYKEDPDAGRMLRFEASLPRLPVPPLQYTADKYLKTVHPLLSQADYNRTERAVKEFVRPGGLGERLQQRLVARANDPNTINWLTEWWNDAAYLTYRDPVVFFVSYFYSYKDDRRFRTPVSRAASIATAVLTFRREVETGQLEPGYTRSLPQTMSSYRWLFNCCRIPDATKDYSLKYDGRENAHIIVIRKNRFFCVPHEYGSRQLSTADLEAQFNEIIAMAGSDSAPAIGALTSENRDNWYSARQALLKVNPENEKLFELIQASSFVICLDDTAPITLEERAVELWHGNGQNRFYDKPTQFIVFENGAAGFLGEHSMMDGTPTHRLNNFVNEFLAKSRIDHEPPVVNQNIPKPKELHFKIDESVHHTIALAEDHFKSLVESYNVRILLYQGYGAKLIKKYKCSPDAYVQMMFQLAYYKMYGVSRPTYESAATFQFRDGRTETCRTVSDESVAFVKAMEDSNVDVKTCVQLARKAIDVHVRYINEATNGLGVDRHLFGLKQLLQPGEEVPEIYKDPAYTYSSKWYISSSQLSSEYFNGYGWGPVIKEGYGLAYQILNNAIAVNITCHKNSGNRDIPLSASKLKHYIREAADDMKAIFSIELESQSNL